MTGPFNVSQILLRFPSKKYRYGFEDLGVASRFLLNKRHVQPPFKGLEEVA